MIDPGTVTSGLSMAGDLAGGIYNAVTAKDRKKKFLKQQREQALHELERNYAASMGMPTYDIDAMARMKNIKQVADEQFKIDPMSFVPFVNKATQFASQIDRAARQDAAKFTDPDGFKYDPQMLVAFTGDEDRRRSDEDRRRRLETYAAGQTYGSYNPWGAYAR